MVGSLNKFGILQGCATTKTRKSLIDFQDIVIDIEQQIHQRSALLLWENSLNEGFENGRRY